MTHKPSETLPTEIDFKDTPERYRMGRGEQGIFHTPPYTQAMLPLWRFATPALAADSAKALTERFLRYRTEDDFVGMDMARKFLQMGMTRSLRYARHPGGRKYGPTGTPLETKEDPLKHHCARIFKEALTTVREDPAYLDAKARYLRRVKQR